MHTAFIRNNVLHTVRTGAGSGGCEKSADEKPVLSSGEITAAGDSQGCNTRNIFRIDERFQKRRQISEKDEQVIRILSGCTDNPGKTLLVANVRPGAPVVKGCREQALRGRNYYDSRGKGNVYRCLVKLFARAN